MAIPTKRIDFDALRRQLGGRCFICEMLAGNPDYEHHIVYEDERAVAFLNRFPAVYGYVLVAPKAHREEVTGDFTTEEYLHIQGVVHRVGEAIRSVVPTERLYILSLGSRQGNSHVHWHLAPLPPGVPFEQQQLAALATDVVFDLTPAEQELLASRLHRACSAPAA
jgi:diadenosine tetraphosphate (Ap4A) HIT family hydrolase